MLANQYSPETNQVRIRNEFHLAASVDTFQTGCRVIYSKEAGWDLLMKKVKGSSQNPGSQAKAKQQDLFPAVNPNPFFPIRVQPDNHLWEVNSDTL